MTKTKIEWVKNPDGSQGYTWGPITGCNNQIEGICQGGNFPCYAYRLANGRLRDRYLANKNTATHNYDEDSYPFYPRFWEDKLFQPFNDKYLSQKGILVCNMSDLFGIGIPKQWTKAVMDVIEDCPNDHFYLLTKCPENLPQFSPFPDNCWVGVTATSMDMADKAVRALYDIKASIKFLSLEPLLSWHHSSFLRLPNFINWVIIGACTGTMKELLPLHHKTNLAMVKQGKKWTLQPQIEWVEEIVRAADRAGVKVFLKDNLILPDGEEPFYYEGTDGDWRIRQEIPKPLPTIDEFVGSDPNFTGDISTEEYIRDIRG